MAQSRCAAKPSHLAGECEKKARVLHRISRNLAETLLDQLWQHRDSFIYFFTKLWFLHSFRSEDNCSGSVVADWDRVQLTKGHTLTPPQTFVDMHKYVWMQMDIFGRPTISMEFMDIHGGRGRQSPWTSFFCSTFEFSG